MLKLDSPIILIGAPRSGTTWLGDALSQAGDLAYWSEPRQVWSYGNYFRHNDVLTEVHASDKIKKYIHSRFATYTRNRGAERFCEKTPSNCLRIRFVHEIFPGAQFIFLIRDVRAIVESARRMQRIITNWKTIRARLSQSSIWEFPAYFRMLPAFCAKMTGRRYQNWGIRPPEWKSLSRQLPPNQFIAQQWAASMEIALRDMQTIPARQKIVLKYEDLTQNPLSHAERLVKFLGVEDEQSIVDYIIATARPLRANAWTEELSKECLEEIRPVTEPTLAKLGYSWGVTS
jgi:hypothetical protein